MKKFKIHQNASIGIVGCGAAAVSFLRVFIEIAQTSKALIKEILIFDNAHIPGTGLAYQKDVENLLINRPLEKMSIHPDLLDDFKIWLNTQPEYHSQVIVEGQAEDDQRSYISRQVFGHYLNAQLAFILKQAEEKNIKIKIIKTNVAAVNYQESFLLETEEGKTYHLDYVLLCNGHNQPADLYQLGDTPAYTNNPYPIHQQKWKKDEDIAIIGNSLTAYDLAISMKKQGHRGKIVLLSRRICYPIVRGKIPAYQLKILTPEAIVEIVEQKGAFSLRDALRLLRKELYSFDHKWKDLFTDNPKKHSFLHHLQQELAAKDEERKWQQVFGSMNQIVEIGWKHLDEHSRVVFMRHFHRLWLNNRTPIPAVNMNHLLEMAQNEQLQMFPEIKHIHYCKDKGKYFAENTQQSQVIVDRVINATGPSRHITENDILMQSLLKNGLATMHKYGGIDVDFDTCSVINQQGKANFKLRAIGHNTAGIYFYTSSVEMVARRAKKCAINLYEYMTQAQIND